MSKRVEEKPMRAVDGVLDSINEHHQVENMVQGSSLSCKHSEECCCYGRVPTASQSEEISMCDRRQRKTDADPVTGPPTAMKIAETFWPYDSFFFFFN